MTLFLMFLGLFFCQLLNYWIVNILTIFWFNYLGNVSNSWALKLEYSSFSVLNKRISKSSPFLFHVHKILRKSKNFDLSKENSTYLLKSKNYCSSSDTVFKEYWKKIHENFPKYFFFVCHRMANFSNVKNFRFKQGK